MLFDVSTQCYITGDKFRKLEYFLRAWCNTLGIIDLSFIVAHTSINTHRGHFWVWNLVSKVLSHQVNMSQKKNLDTIYKRMAGREGNLLLLELTTHFYVTTETWGEKKVVYWVKLSAIYV